MSQHVRYKQIFCAVVPGNEGGGGLAIHELLPGDVPGKLVIPNITPYALKACTDDEIASATTRGINKKGDRLFPLMPYHGLSRMAKDDVEAVIAYIRTLAPIEKSYPARELFIPAAAFGLLPDVDYKNNPRPDTAEMLASKPGKFNTLMPWSFYGTMKDNDLKAIYAYLRTVPPIKSKIEKWPAK